MMCKKTIAESEAFKMLSTKQNDVLDQTAGRHCVKPKMWSIFLVKSKAPAWDASDKHKDG